MLVNFLYFPICYLIIFSFNDSKRNIVWQGFTLKYYAKALSNSPIHKTFVNSMLIGQHVDPDLHDLPQSRSTPWSASA